MRQGDHKFKTCQGNLVRSCLKERKIKGCGCSSVIQSPELKNRKERVKEGRKEGEEGKREYEREERKGRKEGKQKV